MIYVVREIVLAGLGASRRVLTGFISSQAVPGMKYVTYYFLSLEVRKQFYEVTTPYHRLQVSNYCSLLTLTKLCIDDMPLEANPNVLLFCKINNNMAYARTIEVGATQVKVKLPLCFSN
jgi:hypothetical protein